METLRKCAALAGLLATLTSLSCAHGTPSPSTFEVVSITPADGSTSVSASTTVQIEFTDDVHPDSVLYTSNIFVVDDKNMVLRGSFTVSGATVTFSPSGDLEADMTFGVAVRDTVCDLKGIPLRYPKSALFSTGTAVVPLPGFPPFDEYPLLPDASKIVAEIQGVDTVVSGGVDAVERPGHDPVHVNARNVTQDGPWVAVAASANGSFTLTLPGGNEGDTIEVNASFPANGKTGPSVTVTAYLPFVWNLLAASGTGPSARQGHSAVYDANDHRMIVFGGIGNATGFGGVLDDCYALDLTAGSESWTALSPPTTPPGRWGHCAVYDAANDRMIVFGGDTGFLGALNDAWVLDLTPGAESWAPLTPSGTPPAGRALHMAVYDPSSTRVLIFGGRDSNLTSVTQFDELWALNLPAVGLPSWQALATTGTGPTARNGLFGVLDGARSRVLAGFGDSGGQYGGDSYSLSIGSLVWSSKGQPTATGRTGAAVAIDPTSQRLIVFGGQDAGTAYDDLFTFELATDAWSSRQSSGSAPTGRAYASLIWDPVEGRGILFGGGGASAGSVYDHLYQLR